MVGGYQLVDFSRYNLQLGDSESYSTIQDVELYKKLVSCVKPIVISGLNIVTDVDNEEVRELNRERQVYAIKTVVMSDEISPDVQKVVVLKTEVSVNATYYKIYFILVGEDGRIAVKPE